MRSFPARKLTAVNQKESVLQTVKKLLEHKCCSHSLCDEVYQKLYCNTNSFYASLLIDNVLCILLSGMGFKSQKLQLKILPGSYYDQPESGIPNFH